MSLLSAAPRGDTSATPSSAAPHENAGYGAAGATKTPNSHKTDSRSLDEMRLDVYGVLPSHLLKMARSGGRADAMGSSEFASRVNSLPDSGTTYDL